MSAFEIIQQNSHVDLSRDFITSTGVYDHDLSDGYSPKELEDCGSVNFALGAVLATVNTAFIGICEIAKEDAVFQATDYETGQTKDVVSDPTLYNLSVGAEVFARGLVVAGVLMATVGAIQFVQSKKARRDATNSAMAAVDSAGDRNERLSSGFTIEDLERAQDEIRVARLADEMAAEQAGKRDQVV